MHRCIGASLSQRISSSISNNGIVNVQRIDLSKCFTHKFVRMYIYVWHMHKYVGANIFWNLANLIVGDNNSLNGCHFFTDVYKENITYNGVSRKSLKSYSSSL